MIIFAYVGSFITPVYIFTSIIKLILAWCQLYRIMIPNIKFYGEQGITIVEMLWIKHNFKQYCYKRLFIQLLPKAIHVHSFSLSDPMTNLNRNKAFKSPQIGLFLTFAYPVHPIWPQIGLWRKLYYPEILPCTNSPMYIERSELYFW